MRISAAGVLATLCMLSGCVDPAHSRFARKGTCEVSVGSRICTDGDGEGAALTTNGDPSMTQFSGRIPGGR